MKKFFHRFARRAPAVATYRLTVTCPAAQADHVVRLLLAPLRAILLLLVWLGTLLLAITKVVLVALNRVNRDLAGEAHHDH